MQGKGSSVEKQLAINAPIVTLCPALAHAEKQYCTVVDIRIGRLK
jgi:hypothetical protein